MFRSLRLPLARIGRWPRLLAAAACLLLAALSAVNARRSASDPTATAANVRAVVVSARALPAGDVLARRDLAVARWPPRLTPAGTRADPTRLIGQRLAGPVGPGEPLTGDRLVGAGLTRGLTTGTVATPVDLDTDVRAFVRAGDRVDLVATTSPDADPLGSGGSDAGTSSGSGGDAGANPTTGGSATLVARRLLVLAVYRTGDASVTGTQVVLATPRELALRIAGLRSTRTFTIVADSP